MSTYLLIYSCELCFYALKCNKVVVANNWTMEAGDILSESGIIFFYLIQSKLQVTRLALQQYSFFFLVYTYTLSTVVRIWFQVQSPFTFIFQAPGKLNNHKTGILITTLGNTLVFFLFFFCFFLFGGGGGQHFSSLHKKKPTNCN